MQNISVAIVLRLLSTRTSMKKGSCYIFNRVLIDWDKLYSTS